MHLTQLPVPRTAYACSLAALLLFAVGCNNAKKRAEKAMNALSSEVATALANRSEDDETYVIVDGETAVRLLNDHELEHLSIYILEDGSTQSNKYRKKGSDAESHVGGRDLDLLMFQDGQNVYGKTPSDETQFMFAHRRIEGRPVVLEVCLGD